MHESTNRCNGHIQVSPIGGKTQKRDRKGCKKSKIEMIMKNSMGATAKAPKLQHQHQLTAVKKTTSTKLFGGGPTAATTNHHQLQHVINSGSVIKNEIIDDPYTFTDSEPQSVGLYSATNCLSSTRKVQSVPSPVSNAVARKVQSSPAATAALAAAASGTTTTTAATTGNSSSSRTADATGKTMRSVATSVDTMVATAKTINQLQADIARNRVAIVKRRKIVHPPPPAPPPPSNPPPPYLQHLLTLTNHQHQKASTLEQSLLLPPSTSTSSSSSSSLSSTSFPPSSSFSQRHNPPPPPPPPPQRTFARVSLPAKRLARQTTWQRERRSRHELLQRIQEAQQQLHVEKRDLFPLGLELSESEDDDVDETAGGSAEVYQRHWFMGGAEAGVNGVAASARGRESRLAQVRSELRRRLRQAWHGVGGAGGGAGTVEEPPPALVRSVLAAARTQPTATALVLDPRLLSSYSKQSRAKVSMLGVKQCSLCERRALPCTRHCSNHIMYNVDQLLFAYCTAKLADNTQCRVPVFDVLHQLPLCPLHARSHVNLTKPQPDTTPKRSRKKTKPATLNRSRSKKKKKSRSSTSSSSTTTAANFGGVTAGVSLSTTATTNNDSPLTTAASTLATTTTTTPSTLAPISNVDTSVTNIPVNEISDVFQAAVHSDVPQVEIEVHLDGVEVPEEVLAIASMDPAELASQASKLLEDHDFTNMLLPPDAFNDLFTEDKNGQYEPTKEETEELERALEAVDKDVRSLERTLTSRTGLAALPLPLAALPLDTAMTLLDDATGAPLLSAAPPPPPPYAVATATASVAYTTNGHHFATSIQTTDLRNS